MDNIDNKTFTWLQKFSLVVLTFLAFSPFFIWSSSLGIGFSGTTETWSHFGSYFGGIAGPILSFLNLIIIIITLRQQKKSNNDQAEANQSAAQDRLKSDELKKQNYEHQKILFNEKIEHEKQKNTLNAFIKMLEELETLGMKSILDFHGASATLGRYTNPYAWKASSTCVTLRKYQNKFDNNSAEIIYLYVNICRNQISAYTTSLLNHLEIFNNPIEEIENIASNLTSSKITFDKVLKHLEDNYDINLND
jgi:uncharacterized membrane protein